jgi:hypothetical protein
MDMWWHWRGGEKNEQVSGIVCITAMAGSETECTSLKASLCDNLSKQGSDVKYEEIETYVDKQDIQNIKSKSESNKLEILIQEMKVNGNLLLCDFLEMNDV